MARPTLATSAGTFRIKGKPTGIVSGTFNYTLSTPWVNCSADTQVGTIVVASNSSITLATNNDNQVVCDDGVFNDMVYNISGVARGAIVSGLPNGLRLALDDRFNPTTATIT